MLVMGKCYFFAESKNSRELVTFFLPLNHGQFHVIMHAVELNATVWGGNIVTGGKLVGTDL